MSKNPIDIQIPVTIGGVTFKNPFFVASGINIAVLNPSGLVVTVGDIPLLFTFFVCGYA